ncbi:MULTISPECIES: hypothetical protein [Ochrobactrum]|uniref:hypothetical protein n=1 Tax=Ochrobactrum TaxID=528 RepID=UPI00143564CF|nr:hypothetical protein [[Ochrobactrum] soli]MCI0999551.1 hypothetical protein [Ochrobactrum sp. C6C9]
MPLFDSGSKKSIFTLIVLIAASGSALADIKAYEECVRNEQAAATEAYQQEVQNGHGSWVYTTYVKRFKNAPLFCSKQ